MPISPPIRGRSQLSASQINALQAARDVFHVTGDPPLDVDQGPTGVHIRFRPSGFWVELTAVAGGAYSWEERIYAVGGTWATPPQPRTGEPTRHPAYERNSLAVPIGSKVWVWPGFDDVGGHGQEFMFDYEPCSGSGSCPPCPAGSGSCCPSGSGTGPRTGDIPTVTLASACIELDAVTFPLDLCVAQGPIQFCGGYLLTDFINPCNVLINLQCSLCEWTAPGGTISENSLPVWTINGHKVDSAVCWPFFLVLEMSAEELLTPNAFNIANCPCRLGELVTITITI